MRCKDEVLRAELESLLEADNPSEQYFEELSQSLVGKALDQMGDMPPDGGLVGHYRITGKIGRGGMGTVYQAERADNTYRRRVALKVLRRGLDTDDILTRFRSERQILARLNHPNITHMLNGGVTGDGRPWLAMEYVEGLPITGYCDAKKLSINERLDLFLQVCDAVQYAHQNLVIHRDLKPSNILVTPEGVVKLLDFGIAKVLVDTDNPGQQAMITKAGSQPLTPGFASPEQLLNQPVGTESDVYSLGALLCLLLTGRLPFEDNSLAAAMERLSDREDAPLPSRIIGRLWSEEKYGMSEADGTMDGSEIAGATTGAVGMSRITVVAANRGLDVVRLQRRLKGDLDIIAITALKAELSRRYATVKSMADDIRRHLNNHPVSARPDGWRYRSGKFISRHKTGVAVGVLLPLMIITGLYLHGEQLEKERDLARTAAERAEMEAEKAQEVSAFLTGLFRSADPYETAEELTSIELLERGREQLAEVPEPTEVTAEMSAVLGNIYYRLGRYD
ncbi:MAG: serine/threonine protein kinase, partial [Balneolaceae bacterium]